MIPLYRQPQPNSPIATIFVSIFQRDYIRSYKFVSTSQIKMQHRSGPRALRPFQSSWTALTADDLPVTRAVQEGRPDSKVHGAYMGPTRGRQDPGGSHVGPMNLAIRGGVWEMVRIPTSDIISQCIWRLSRMHRTSRHFQTYIQTSQSNSLGYQPNWIHRSEAMYISMIGFWWTSTETKSFQ